MKKYLLSSALLFSFIIGNSQIVELVSPSATYTGTAANTTEVLNAHWDVVNISGSTMAIGCSMSINQTIPGSEYQFCWGEICTAYQATAPTTTEAVTLAPGESTDTFHGKFQHNGNSGVALVRYCWNNVADQFSAFCYEVAFCVDSECALISVQEQTPAAGLDMISPNPVTDLGMINYHFTSAPSSGKITICNSLGAVVKKIDLDSKNGSVFFSASDFENGLYFCSIEENGKVYQTQRIVINQ